jgi:hypothetical protein
MANRAEAIQQVKECAKSIGSVASRKAQERGMRGADARVVGLEAEIEILQAAVVEAFNYIEPIECKRVIQKLGQEGLL